MKDKLSIVSLLLSLLISCSDNIKNPVAEQHFVNFQVNPTNVKIKPGETVTLNAYIKDTTLENLKSEPLPDKLIYWEIIAGAGSLSDNKGNSIIYTSPSSIPTSNLQVIIRAIPAADFRYEKYVYIDIETIEPKLDTGICFTRDILPIFNSNCAMSGCHDSKTHKEGFDLTTYNSIIKKDFKKGNPKETKIYKVLFKKGEERMPPPPKSPLPNEQIDLIYRWILEGAKNEPCSDMPRTGCDTINITYSVAIMNILKYNCLGCHSTSKPQGNVNLESYTNVKKHADDGSLLGSLRHQNGYAPMPSNNLKLNSCYMRQIELWVEGGAKNN